MASPEAPNLLFEQMSIKERGQWVLAEAQNSLLGELEANLAYGEENLDGWVSPPPVNVIKSLIERTKGSPNLVYKKKGVGEYLEGHLDEYGEVSVRRDDDNWHGTESLRRNNGLSDKEIWGNYEESAKLRGEMARKVVSKIGFAVIGKEIPERPERVVFDSYDIPPKLPSASEEYQQRAAEIMRVKYLEGLKNVEAEGPDYEYSAESRKFYLDRLDILDRTIGLEYRWGYDFYTMYGTLNGKHLEAEARGVHSGPESYYIRWGSNFLPQNEAEALFRQLHEVVSGRDLKARSLQDHDQYILEQLGVA